MASSRIWDPYLPEAKPRADIEGQGSHIFVVTVRSMGSTKGGRCLENLASHFVLVLGIKFIPPSYL